MVRNKYTRLVFCSTRGDKNKHRRYPRTRMRRTRAACFVRAQPDTTPYKPRHRPLAPPRNLGIGTRVRRMNQELPPLSSPAATSAAFTGKPRTRVPLRRAYLHGVPRLETGFIVLIVVFERGGKVQRRVSLLVPHPHQGMAAMDVEEGHRRPGHGQHGRHHQIRSHPGARVDSHGWI